MVTRSICFEKLKPVYLFPEMEQRKRRFLEKHPNAHLLHLGVGDTILPLPSSLVFALKEAANELGTREGYRGYGEEQGLCPLREKISSHIYQGEISPEEIFISDGAKPDIGRLQLLFGKGVRIAMQNPTYPIYLEGSLLHGVESITLLPCLPENDFFPTLTSLPPIDLLYLCSPNNPTGNTFTHKKLQEIVSYAQKNRAVILFDAAYSGYIQDPSLPYSIFEVEGAKEVAIEINSFSKLAGFAGVRLGWTVVPKALSYSEGGMIWQDWKRLMATVFNGPSILSQKGGLALFGEGCLEEVKAQISYYMENAKILKKALLAKGHTIYGGENAPYLWVYTPAMSSWDAFEHYLECYHLVVTPGVGFGSAGEHFVRISAFGYRDHIQEAALRLSEEI
jgi:LL-diaminopimelate aminotransferase